MGLGVVRVINYVNGNILCELVCVGGGLYRGMIVWIKVREAVWVLGWVWGVVKTIFSDWVNVLKALSLHPSSQTQQACL